MKFKEVATSNASAEAKVAALALLLDKELIKLADTVLNVKKLQGPQGEQGLQGPKGEQGDRGFDGTNGKDGVDGKDGKDGKEGKDGVGVQDAKIDFDGSLVITLTNGREINAGDVVPEGAADKIKVVKSGGGNSQTVLDAIEEIQATIATYGTMATQNDNAVAITGGSINGTTIGAAVPATGVFTTLTASTLTATGQTSLGGAAGSESLRVLTNAGQNSYVEVTGGIYGTSSPKIIARNSGAGAGFNIANGNQGPISFYTNDIAGQTNQFRISHTASAVNYVQVTGAATGSQPYITAQGSDSTIGFNIASKGTSFVYLRNAGTTVQFSAGGTSTAVNYLNARGNPAGTGPQLEAVGSDTNIDLTLTPKGTGNVRFGTLTASADAPVTGYITIKDSGGTVRKLAVIA